MKCPKCFGDHLESVSCDAAYLAQMRMRQGQSGKPLWVDMGIDPDGELATRLRKGLAKKTEHLRVEALRAASRIAARMKSPIWSGKTGEYDIGATAATLEMAEDFAKWLEGER